MQVPIFLNCAIPFSKNTNFISMPPLISKRAHAGIIEANYINFNNDIFFIGLDCYDREYLDFNRKNQINIKNMNYYPILIMGIYQTRNMISHFSCL